jgi:hypothetical protein
MKSRTDKDDPSIDMPYTDSAEPMRAKVLRDRELPKWMKSNTDSDDPKRGRPYTDIVEPIRI